MAFVAPVTLRLNGLRLEPLATTHEAGLAAAAADGALWRLRVAGVPRPEKVGQYIQRALSMREQGSRMAFAVLDETSDRVLGSTSYHDIVPAIRRVEIGYTWYGRSAHRSHVNTSCKLMLLQHAFETLNCGVVGWRTDQFNFASQRAIERLGAKKDGVIRHHALRPDGSVRDTVMYSVIAGEWPQIKAHLQDLLQQHAAPPHNHRTPSHAD